MLKLFNFLEQLTDNQNKLVKTLYFIFIPIFYLLELLVYFYFWKRIIIPELLTNDEIVEFLDKNEFAYTGNKIHKMDLLDNNEFYERLNLEQSKEVIKQDFVVAITDLINKNCPTNIEEYLNLTVNTEIKTIHGLSDNNKIYRSKVYSVSIQFCRYYFLSKAFNLSLIWLFTSVILGILMFFIKNSIYFL